METDIADYVWSIADNRGTAEMNGLRSLQMPQLLFVFFAVALIWVIFRSRGPHSG